MKKSRFYVIDALLLIILIFIDQFTKYLAVINLKDKIPKTLINGVLQLNYLENRGAAFGMFQNQKIFFVFIAVVFLAVIFYVIIKTPADKKYMLMHILLVMIGAGAVGNLIDRVRLNYVVDFIYFSLINFPIFNFADICVTVGTIVFVILILFVYKDNDFSFLKLKEDKKIEDKQ